MSKLITIPVSLLSDEDLLRLEADALEVVPELEAEGIDMEDMKEAAKELRAEFEDRKSITYEAPQTH